MDNREMFACKAYTVEMVRAGRAYPTRSRFAVMDEIVLDAAEWRSFELSLLTDRAWLHNFSVLAMRSHWYTNDGERPCLLVKNPDGTEGLLVDTQGYDYARYVAIAPAESL